MLSSFWHRIRLEILVIIIIGASPALCWPEAENVPAPGSAAERFKSIWDAAKLYQNPDNPVIQSFSLIGRYQGQYWSVDADQGNADGWENRRTTFGFNLRLYRDFLIHSELKFNPDDSSADPEMDTAYVKWTPADTGFAARLGRLSYAYIGMERSTSSRKISTFERGQLVDQLMPSRALGLHLEKNIDKFLIQGGLYSGSIGKGFDRVDAGLVAGLGLAYKFPLFLKKGNLHLDYLYNDGDPGNNAFKPYRQIVSLWYKGNRGAFGLGMDLTGGSGGFAGQPDVLGFTLLPTYDISNSLWIGGDKLQLALRYQYANSDGDNGLQLQDRYEQEVTTGEGDRYQAFYTGLNYLIYGDRLKLMAGAEYSNMKDAANDGGEFRGWTYLAGLRLFF
jgi:phosphate-selective porin OprO/OprP